MANPTLVLPQPKMLIGGQRASAADERLIVVENPANGDTIASIPAGNASDVDAAVATARAAFEGRAWGRMRPLDRGKILERLATLIEDKLEELALLECLDNGMPLTHARAFVAHSAEVMRYMAGWPSKLCGKINPVSADGARYHSYSQPVPIGVVGAIVPWNAPLAMASWKVATALAAGCTVVLKPSELTPLTALRLAELALEAGLPEGVLNIVTGYGHEAGQALVEHPGIDKIAFTGSSRVGQSIVATAAKDLKRVSLELGGKSPSIVFGDADLERAAPGVAFSIFANAGQVCVAGSRLFIEHSAFEKVVEAISGVAKSMVVGNGLDEATFVGPLISGTHRDRVLNYIERGISEGGEVVMGGKAKDGKGYFVEPTVFANTAADATIMREEIFGPVLVATPFKDIDEVVKFANDTHYGLGGFVWTSDFGRAHGVAERINSGSVWINTGYVIDPAIPFGGTKQSGWGREMSEEGVRAFTETRTITAYVGP